MIYVDSRVGSKELFAPLQALGLEVALTTLEFGDVCFEGKGPKTSLVEIGIELKTLGDAISSLRSGRLSGHQLPGLRQTYTHTWLILEGQWRHNEAGQITTYQGPKRGWKISPGKMSASEFEKQILTLELCGGVIPRYTNRRADTLRFIYNLFRWWTDAAYDKHKSHLRIHESPPLIPVSDYRAFYMKIPGVGYKLSQAVENHFKGGPRQAVCASIDEWANITQLSDEGKLRKLGNKVATKIVAFLRGGL